MAEVSRVVAFDQGDALLRRILESAAVGMIVIGMDGRLIYSNRAFAEMLGYDPAECAGLDAHRLLHVDDPEAGTHLADMLLGKLADHRGEHRVARRDGRAIWVLVSASVIESDKTGRPLYLVVQLMDIDRQKRAEADLAASESRWSFALDAARQGVWDHDIRRDRMFYSDTWRTMRGFAPGEEIDDSQASWLERVHPDDRARILSVVDKQDSGEDGFDVLEYRERHRDGHYVWILSRGRPVEWDADGRPVRTVGTDTDVTRLKTVELQLAEEKERLRVTLESIGDGVISTDCDSRILFMNPIAEAMTGWSEAEAVGRLLDDVFVTVDQVSGAATPNPVAECLATGGPVYCEADVALVGRGLESRAIRTSAAPVRDGDGHLHGAVLVFQDVTQSRALQRELAHSASHDVLTGLPNRAAFDRALRAACDSARIERRRHVLCYIDLDRFKPVNDSAGHAAGDALLRQVAETIRLGCRGQDMAARIGGDEFTVLLTDCALPNGRMVASKIVDAIAALEFEWGGRTYRIGASIGIAAVTGKTPPATVLAEADAACYAAKAGGRGRVMLASDLPRLGRAASGAA